MKKIFKYLVAVLIVPIAFMCVGCNKVEQVVSIKDIERTGGNELVNEYTITYTNGETDTFTIVNGEDGENLYTNITINDLYNQVKDGKPDGYSLIDFIDEYLDIKIDNTAIASSKALRSAVSVFTEHSITIPDYNNIISYTQTAFGLQPNYGVKNSIAIGAGAGVIYKLDNATGDAYIITNYHVCFSTDSSATDGVGTKFVCYAYGAQTIDYEDLYYLNYYNENCKDYADKFEYDINGLPIIDYGYGAIEAEYVGGSEQYDIAVLKVTASDVLKDSDYLPIDKYNSDLVTPGTTAIAVGNPDAAGISVSNGVVSVDSEYISIQISDSAVVLREFRIDTPVNPGNSGGGLFDSQGRLIGIVNAKESSTSYENMGYAIPSNIAVNIADSIIDNCDGTVRKTKKVTIGMTIQAIDSTAEYNEETGLFEKSEVIAISEIVDGSVAQALDLRAGDVINSVTIIKSSGKIDVTIDRTFKLIDAMLMVRAGDSVEFNYTRGATTTTIATPILADVNFVEVV